GRASGLPMRVTGPRKPTCFDENARDRLAPTPLSRAGNTTPGFALALADAAIEPSQPVAASAARPEKGPPASGLVVCLRQIKALPSQLHNLSPAPAPGFDLL